MDYEEKKRKVIKALKKIDPTKPYGSELFNAIARVSVSFAIEIVALRLGEGIDGLEVFLTKRADSEIAYPSQWHCPGSIFRPGENFEDVLNRLVKEEFSASIEINRAKPIGLINYPEEVRGHFISQVYLLEQNEVGTKGRWFPTDQLPQKTLDLHIKRAIPFAVSRYNMIQLWTRTKE